MRYSFNSYFLLFSYICRVYGVSHRRSDASSLSTSSPPNSQVWWWLSSPAWWEWGLSLARSSANYPAWLRNRWYLIRGLHNVLYTFWVPLPYHKGLWCQKSQNSKSFRYFMKLADILYLLLSLTQYRSLQLPPLSYSDFSNCVGWHTNTPDI